MMAKRPTLVHAPTKTAAAAGQTNRPKPSRFGTITKHSLCLALWTDLM
uniref:Uncharacterized protein n=1 Tax=Rhizophora mucronata TaxID=61149 RepID=A0A2P2N8M1_RHIMU